jgi:branched-chain amino acid transport system substrate-binding protein
MRTLSGSIAILGVLLFSVPASAADPYEINVILPVTGQGAFIAKGELNALSVIEQQVNGTGGVRGRPIKFVVQDDQSNPELSVQLVNGVLAKKPPFVIGPSLTSSCGATAALFKDGPVDYCL